MEELIERRLYPRKEVQVEGIVVSSDGLTRLAVSVTNLSQSGARLVLTEQANLPPTFTLLFSHAIQPCRLVWRQDDRAGVNFMD